MGPLLAAFSSVALLAQDYTIPRQLDGVPGNAAISMPVRWSQGVMQVIWDQSLIPEFKGRILRRIRLRRPLGFRLECATVLAPDANDQNPFLPFKGLAPIVTFGF